MRKNVKNYPAKIKYRLIAGPDHWPEKYKTCAGKYQSPIDIEEQYVTRVKLPPLVLTGFHNPASSANITNNGHTGRCPYNRPTNNSFLWKGSVFM